MAENKEVMNEEKVYTPNRKREIIKTILIIFLAALLVLTFFSNTIMNRSLAEISTERTASGKLTERIRGNGTVESNQAYEVKVDGNKTIDTIMIKTGQEVKKDDVLFTVGGGDSEEIKTAEKQLSELELAYQKALLTLPADYSKENQAIADARAELNAAIAKRDSYSPDQGSDNSSQDTYNANKSQLNYYTKLQTKLQNTISAIDMDEYASAAPEYSGQLVKMKNELDEASAAYSEASTLFTTLAAGDAPQEEIDSAKADMEAKSAKVSELRSAYNDYKYSLRNDLVSQLTDAENNVDYYTGLVGDGMSSSVDMPISSVSDAVSYDQLVADVEQKQRALEGLISDLNKAKREGDNASALSNLELAAQKKEIDRAKEELEKLKKKNDVSEIKSKYSGVVSSINIKPGETTVPDSPLAIIDLSDEGFTMTINIDAEKAKKVKKGAKAEILNNWGGDVEAVVSEIKNSSQAGSREKSVKLTISGDVTSGEGLEIAIPCGSASYDAIVPRSAVQDDNEGKYVLTVRSKSSPLGNRYYAEKVKVEVLASDDNSCAVSGSIANGDYVITAASKPVDPGDQVRMKEK
ncbi:HlyD family efflux transporter periplasmic adaptor subunit [Ruminococcus sp. XPD3002]|uniref:HlyD family efflux transporter periplasmic adaptor subunit n=1 Tax=Ruminococcus sp. XPD3002 TaxID=1452269 RepID=UPI000919C342|nr:Multidrug efflux pump subunit AcrA (membrane-fusion protein) [Ruminococcus flavefaciens]HPY84134.1 HlyD family efflux transporter periplasmic adaptor subunit [Ruminococcus flavefaciens]